MDIHCKEKTNITSLHSNIPCDRAGFPKLAIIVCSDNIDQIMNDSDFLSINTNF